MNTLIRVRKALHALTQSIAEATGQFDTIAYEFRFIRDHFPMRAHGYPPRKPNRTRKKQRLSRLARRQKRQQRIK